MLDRRMPDKKMMVDTTIGQLSMLDDTALVESMMVNIKRMMQDYCDDSHPCQLMFSSRLYISTIIIEILIYIYACNLC